jgi:hypothetical protein
MTDIQYHRNIDTLSTGTVPSYLTAGAGITNRGSGHHDPMVNLGLKVEWASYLRDPHPLKILYCTTWLPESPSKDSASPHLACSLQELHHRDVKMHEKPASTPCSAGQLFYFSRVPAGSR